MAEKSTVEVGPWPKGIDNRSPDYAVPADALRNAVDVDLGRDGRVRRRKGYARIVDVVAPHSLYSCEAGVFFAAQGTLYRLNDDDTTTAVLTGLTGTRIAYEYFNDVVYLSDGVVAKRLLSGLVAMDWGIPRPAAAPVINTTSGDLYSGTFTAAVSFINTLGEESPLGPIAQITTNATGGFVISGFPNATSSDVTHVRLYFSGSGSTTLYHIADIALGATSYTISERTDTGKAANTRVFVAPPVASIIRQHHGRMFFAVGNIVHYTEPYAFNLVDPVKNFWEFDAPVMLLEPVESGLYIAAGNTYFYRFKDPDDAVVTKLFNYDAIPYASTKLPHNEGVMWQSTRGTIMAGQDGNAKNIQEERTAADTAATGAALLRETDGLRQFIVSTPDSNVSPLAAKSFFDAEIIRRGS